VHSGGTYFAHVYIWGPITKSKWLVGLGGQIFFHSEGGTFTHIPPLPTPLLLFTVVMTVMSCVDGPAEGVGYGLAARRPR